MTKDSEDVRARELLILSGMHESTNQAVGLVEYHIVVRAMLAFANEARLAENERCARIAEEYPSREFADIPIIRDIATAIRKARP